MDTQNIRIEKMKFEHIEQIAAIEKACFGQNAWSGALFYSELLDGNKHYFVAVKNNSVIGYGGYAHILDEAHIMNIAVEAHTEKGRVKLNPYASSSRRAKAEYQGRYAGSKRRERCRYIAVSKIRF